MGDVWGYVCKLMECGRWRQIDRTAYPSLLCDRLCEAVFCCVIHRRMIDLASVTADAQAWEFGQGGVFNGINSWRPSSILSQCSDCLSVEAVVVQVVRWSTMAVVVILPCLWMCEFVSAGTAPAGMMGGVLVQAVWSKSVSNGRVRCASH
jgi:hypothetical protein